MKEKFDLEVDGYEDYKAVLWVLVHSAIFTGYPLMCSLPRQDRGGLHWCETTEYGL